MNQFDWLEKIGPPSGTSELLAELKASAEEKKDESEVARRVLILFSIMEKISDATTLEIDYYRDQIDYHKADAAMLRSRIPKIPVDEEFWSAVNDILYQTERSPHWNMQLAFSDGKSLGKFLTEVLPLRENTK